MAAMFVAVLRPVIVRLLNVLAPLIVNVVIWLLVSDTLLKVSPGEVNEPVVLLKEMVDVPALNVNPVAEETVNAPVNDNELAPRFNVRVCVEPLE